MKKNLLIPIFLLFFASCQHSNKSCEPSIISMQLVDRNGFAETISTKDRIEKYTKTNFLDPQPFQKVLRVYGKTGEGKNNSILTTYHQNGHIWQYLEVTDGRANGSFKEWHANGQLRIQLNVIEGMADLQEAAQKTWVFDQTNKIWDEKGHLMAEISYAKGVLHGNSSYFHENGTPKKIIPYTNDTIEGDVVCYDEQGNIIEFTPFKQGAREGKSLGYFCINILKFQEKYENDLLMDATYFNEDGKKIAEIKNGNGYQATFDNNLLCSLVQFQKGLPKGKVEVFNALGIKTGTYSQLDGKKHGEELLYYIDEDGSKAPKNKISLHWDQDVLMGEVKTWYENQTLESQREFNQNKLHGTSLAWYKNGDLMLMEEYEHNKVMKGSYFKKGDKKPVSKIDNGKGTATIYSPEGVLIRKITYEKGAPILDDASS